MSKEQQIKAFKRHTLANLCFVRAKAVADFLIDEQPPTHEPLYSPMVTGMVVTYMRPFVSAHGLGPLPSQFSKFRDKIHGDTHAEMIKCRNSIHAHQDLLAQSQISPECGSTSPVLSITFEPPNSCAIIPRVLELHPDSIPNVAALCMFQQSRIADAIETSWEALTDGKTYTAGTYTVGQDFP